MVTTFSLLSVVSFQREKGKIVIMSTPDPSSLSLDKNNTSAKVRVEGYLDNAYADLQVSTADFVLFKFVLHISLRL